MRKSRTARRPGSCGVHTQAAVPRRGVLLRAGTPAARGLEPWEQAVCVHSGCCAFLRQSPRTMMSTYDCSVALSTQRWSCCTRWQRADALWCWPAPAASRLTIDTKFMSIALCGSMCNIIKHSMVADYLQPLTVSSCVRLFFGAA